MLSVPPTLPGLRWRHLLVRSRPHRTHCFLCGPSVAGILNVALSASPALPTPYGGELAPSYQAAVARAKTSSSLGAAKALVASVTQAPPLSPTASARAAAGSATAAAASVRRGLLGWQAAAGEVSPSLGALLADLGLGGPGGLSIDSVAATVAKLASGI